MTAAWDVETCRFCESRRACRTHYTRDDYLADEAERRREQERDDGAELWANQETD